MAKGRRGTKKNKSSRPKFKRLNWGVWATRGNECVYLGEVQADTRGHAKQKAVESKFWQIDERFRDKTQWVLRAGCPP
ncbi:MAG: hypothetical protein ACTSWU_00880 [Candidatus Thorarchaeota archaeon]